MKRDHTRILKQLSMQAATHVTRGMAVVLIDSLNSDLPLYGELVELRFVKIRNTYLGRTYQITRKGWDALSKGAKQKIIAEYERWYKFTRPTVAVPNWLKWTK